MPFDIALSGIRAANSDLQITGNNIANASTVGFKESRAEFGAIYASSILGGGNQLGSGVAVDDVSQQFSQGNISFTENPLDLAVNGSGLFIVSNGGEINYTRAGAFSLDSDGFITSNNGSRLQGYQADELGEIEPIQTDLRLEVDTIEPGQTTSVVQSLNLDATAPVRPINGLEFESLGPDIGVAQAGALNGYIAQSLTIQNPDGSTNVYQSNENESAASIASELDSIPGISASAETSLTVNNIAGVINPLGVTLNGINLSAIDENELATEINLRSNSSLPGISAEIDIVTGDLVISSPTGSNITLSIAGDAGASLDITGSQGGVQTITVGGTDQATVGGVLSVVQEEGTEIVNFSPDATGLFGPSGAITFEDVVVNDFDPNDSNTFNSATSTTIFDSLGIPHVMNQYFVKQPFNPTDPTSSPNQWQMHVLIDGQNVGNPDATADDPLAATVATYDVFFNSNGQIDEGRSNQFLISNWDPGTNALAADPTGAVSDPAVSSNFFIDLSDSSQFGFDFSVNSVEQNGFTSGQLSGLNVDDSGIIFARFTNGESLNLGQVILADFDNLQGLQPLSGTAWAETFESGIPVINTPGTGSLGAIQSGALEDSNVDLSEQLVALIIAQRNYQASAQTIEAADTVTQTIINL